jgi:hypothetical protein
MALPEIQIRIQPSLRSIISDVVDAEPHGVSPATSDEYDLFISHATEDKPGIVRALVEALQQRSVNVWYDEFELRIGDSLRRKIDQGLSRSRFGLVVVSHAFFAKNWPQYELDGLVALEMAGRQRILGPNGPPLTAEPLRLFGNDRSARGRTVEVSFSRGC